MEMTAQAEPAFKPFDAVLYDREESTGLYFLPGTLAEKPRDNWGHLVVGHAVPRTLTEAELAAMYWHARHAQMVGGGIHNDADGRIVDEAAVLERFATLPAVR
ncbi:hypothetical protein GCM10023063_16170 [Arthrobacter methylotrophus]|uniref:Uncharacterized protein n=1 Tax=Arthrobacter methylotrophus TaxID=121291 RepID=A0ABV5UNE6_9MICC